MKINQSVWLTFCEDFYGLIKQKILLRFVLGAEKCSFENEIHPHIIFGHTEKRLVGELLIL